MIYPIGEMVRRSEELVVQAHADPLTSAVAAQALIIQHSLICALIQSSGLSLNSQFDNVTKELRVIP